MRLCEYLAKINDNDYFAYAEIALGKIETPFHKPKITAQLLSFYQDENIQKEIRIRLTDNERLILSALSIATSLEKENLEMITAFREDELTLLVSSLSHRLIILSDKEGRLCLNDDLNLSPYLAYTPLLGKNEEQTSSAYADKNTIAAMIGLLTSGEISSSSLHFDRFFSSEVMQGIFPRLKIDQILTIARVCNERLQDFHLLAIRNGRIIGNLPLSAFLALSEEDILAYLLFDNAEKGKKFLSILPHIGTVAEADAEKMLTRIASLALLNTPPSLSILTGFGLITEKDGVYTPNRKAPAEQSSQFTIDSDLSVSFLFSLGKNDLLPLFAAPHLIDTLCQYMITRESVTKAFDIGITPEEISSYLDTRTSGQVPPLLLKRLKDWKEDYDMVKVYDGIIIVTDEMHSRIIENLPLLKIHIRKKLSPTVFLLKRESEAQWRRILLYAGLEMLGKTNTEPGYESQSVEEYDESGISYPPLPAMPELGCESSLDEKPDDSAILQKIREFSTNREEIEIRTQMMRSRLVISPRQIVKGGAIPHPLKATGFDVKGKAFLISSLIEKKGNRCALVTDEGECLVSILALASEEGEECVQVYDIEKKERSFIPIRKIFLAKELIS